MRINVRPVGFLGGFVSGRIGLAGQFDAASILEGPEFRYRSRQGA